MKKIMPKLLAVMLIITVTVIGSAIPVNAISPPIGAIEMLAEGLAMEMGIGAGLEFGSSSSAQSFAVGLYQALKEEIDELLLTASVIYTGIVGGYKLVANIGADLWAEVKGYVDNNYNEGENTIDGDPEPYTGYSTTAFALQGTLYVRKSGVLEYKFYISGSSLEKWNLSNGTWHRDNLVCITIPSGTVGAVQISSSYCRWGYITTSNNSFYQSFQDNGTFTYYTPSEISTGVIGTTGIIDNPNHDLINVGTGGRDIGIDVVPVPPTQADIPISDSVGFDLSGTLYDDAVGRDYTDVQAVPVEGTNVGSLSEIEYVDTWTEAEDYQVNLTEIFPFCIPFDVIRLVQAMTAEPVAPSVDYAFIVPSLGVNVPIELDLSDFDTVAQIVRTCELVLFAVGLMFITYKMIKW